MPRKISLKQKSIAAAGNPVKHYSAMVHELYTTRVEHLLAEAGLERFGGVTKHLLDRLTNYDPSHPVLGQGRYVNIKKDELKALFSNGTNYLTVLELLIENGIVQRLATSLEPNGTYMIGGFAKAYRIAPSHWPDEDRDPAHSAQLRLDPVASYKIWQEQQNYLKNIKTDAHRLGLAQMTQLICSTIDDEQAWVDVNVLYSRDKSATFGNSGTIDMKEAIDLVHGLRDGRFYVNPRDKFGSRFHTPLTNSVKEIRQYVRPEPGVTAQDIDFKNSQYYLFALVAKYPAAVLAIMKDSNVCPQLLRMIERVCPAYKDMADFREFCDQALAGTLYGWLAELSGQKVDFIKIALMKTLMSDNTEYAKLKSMLREHIPSVVDICGDLNEPTELVKAEWRRMLELPSMADKSYRERMKAKDDFWVKENVVPMVLQNLESIIVVDNIAVSAIGNNAKRFTTVHDSFLTHPDNELLITRLITDFFEFYGVPAADHPKVKSKRLVGNNCPDATAQEIAAVPPHIHIQTKIN